MSKKKTAKTTKAGQATMLAWAINDYGEPMQLMDLPVPLFGPDDVLIRMHGAEVGDWDDLVRVGGWPMERPFPLALGLAGAGTVAAVGHNVERFEKDDQVYTYSYPLYNNGAWARFMVVHQSYVAFAPASMDLKQAGTFPIIGLTAHETLMDILRVREGEIVLITPGAGGVGHLAIQLAAHAGAHVVTTASKQNQDFVVALGAETVIDYTKENIIDSVRARYKNGVDKALNGVAGETADRVAETLHDGGHMVDLTGSVSVSRPGVRIVSDYVVRADGERLQLLADMIDNKDLQVEIQEIFPFERAPEALKTVLNRHVRGKIGIEIT